MVISHAYWLFVGVSGRAIDCACPQAAQFTPSVPAKEIEAAVVNRMAESFDDPLAAVSSCLYAQLDAEERRDFFS